MAPVIWGLDLKEMQWGKFKSSYMFGNRDYHLRRTKFIVYQCALIFCVVSESLGTAALSDYIDAQDFVKGLDRRVYVYNNDYVGVASYNIFAGVFVAFIFGAAFFFDLFWPARSESKGVRIAWKVCGILAVLFYTADVFALTVITATRCQHFAGPGISRNSAYATSLLNQFKKDGGTPVCYRDNGRAIAAVVFCWPGWLSVIGSCILLFFSIDNAEKGPGPMSAHARQSEGAEAEIGSVSEKEKDDESRQPSQIQPPAPIYQTDGVHDAAALPGTASVAAHNALHERPVDAAAAATIQPHQHAGNIQS